MAECVKTLFEVDGLVKILWDSPCMMVLWKLSELYIWVNIWCMLHWLVGLEETHFLWHLVAQLVSAKNEILLWLCENTSPFQCLTFDGKIWWNEELCTSSKTENGCCSNCKRMKLSGPNEALCQLATWAENAVKLEL